MLSSNDSVPIVSKVQISTGCPKKMHLLSSFEFLTLGGVVLGVKSDSKNFGNKKNIGLLSNLLNIFVNNK